MAMSILRKKKDEIEPQTFDSSESFTQEQVRKAIQLSEEYERVVRERAENREILRRLAALGKISYQKVNSLYAPYRRRK